MSIDEKPISHQLRYYIALAAPPTRAPVDGSEAFLRAELDSICFGLPLIAKASVFRADGTKTLITGSNVIAL